MKKTEVVLAGCVLKGSAWTGDGKYLANVLTWLDFQEKHTLQPHGVTVAAGRLLAVPEVVEYAFAK